MSPRAATMTRWKMAARDKVKELAELQLICQSARRSGKRVVFTNGCFDLLHVGHVRYLEAARAMGDLLLVGVNSDSSMQFIKGPLRPITPESERSELIAALQCVDYVVLFSAPDPLAVIQSLRPEILVKGSDWPLDGIVGAEVVLQSGGTVAQVPIVPDTSTSLIIERILARFNR